MSVWKSVKIEPAVIRGVHGMFFVIETRAAQDGETTCIEDPAFVSDAFDLEVGCFIELHTRVSQLVSHRTSYAIELCDHHERRHLAATWNFKVLYGDSN